VVVKQDRKEKKKLADVFSPGIEEKE